MTSTLSFFAGCGECGSGSRPPMFSPYALMCSVINRVTDGVLPCNCGYQRKPKLNNSIPKDSVNQTNTIVVIEDRNLIDDVTLKSSVDDTDYSKRKRDKDSMVGKDIPADISTQEMDQKPKKNRKLLKSVKTKKKSLVL